MIYENPSSKCFGLADSFVEWEFNPAILVLRYSFVQVMQIMYASEYILHFNSKSSYVLYGLSLMTMFLNFSPSETEDQVWWI